MRMTVRKKEILSYFAPDYLDFVTGEIGPPPLDVSGLTYLLYGVNHSREKRHQLESTRRTLEAMVEDGLLERIRVRESRQGAHTDTTATVIRYGLPGTCTVMRDTDGKDGVIEGEYIRVNDQ